MSCSNKQQFKTLLKDIAHLNLIFVCDNDTLIDVASLLAKHSNLKTVLVLTNQNHLLWPVELEDRHFRSIQANDEKELMRRLYFDAAICYYEQGIAHQQIGNHSASDSCLDFAQDALNQAQSSC